jgi:hypothetical protein
MRRRMSLCPAPTTGLRPVDEPTGFAQDRRRAAVPTEAFQRFGAR